MSTGRLTNALLMIGLLASRVSAAGGDDVAAVRAEADRWRAEHRLIDLHQHVEATPERLARAVRIMDEVGIGIAVSLGSGTVTRGPDGEPSEFERAKTLTDDLYPGRFVHYMVLDYRGWDEPDFPERAAKQIEEGHRLGAAGLKEFKRLGLYLRDRNNKLVRVDDPRLDAVWAKCGELGMPVSIHVGDPKAFWEPFNDANERWAELKDHRDWWFGDPNRYPPRMEIVEALSRVIERHPRTTFVGVHFANNPEDLAWVDAALSRYPNMMADLAARIPEIGRQDPGAVRELFVKHQDRILFATDFMVYGRLILGSSGNEPPPTDADARVFFEKHWRWLETNDRDWPHMTPIQGDWTVSSIGLPAPVLRKVYFDNARKLLARSLPAPTLKADRLEADFAPDGDLSKPAWRAASPATLEYTLADAVAVRPDLATEVRCLWSPTSLYVSFSCPFTTLTVFDPPSASERLGLWDRDVVEVFVGTDPAEPGRYVEFEVAPTNERLDVAIDPGNKDFAWDSRFESAVKVDEATKRWTAEVRIPASALSTQLKAGTRLRLNLFRSDVAGGAFLAWNPTLQPTTHVPARFGTLELQ
jgi:predicted TIM-barrel fold metal-dependent hydrolase